MSDALRCIVLTLMTAVVVVAMGLGAAMVAASDPTNRSETSSPALSPVPARVDLGTDSRNAYKASQLDQKG